jgi:hypothetical protein
MIGTVNFTGTNVKVGPGLGVGVSTLNNVQKFYLDLDLNKLQVVSSNQASSVGAGLNTGLTSGIENTTKGYDISAATAITVTIVGGAVTFAVS